MNTEPDVDHSLGTSRLEISTGQLAATLDSRLYAEHLSERDVALGCARAVQWGLASVIVRPERLRVAADALAGSAVGLAAAVGWESDDRNPIQPLAVLDEAQALVSAGATEVGLVATDARLSAGDGALFRETVEGLVAAMGVLGVRVRLILDTETLSCSQIRDACTVATDAYVWMAQGGSWRGKRASILDVELMRAALPADILLKWTEPVRRMETMLLCIAMGVDRFNGDVDTLMAAALRAEWLGPLTIPRAGIDF